MSNKDIIAKIKAEIERRMDKHWEGLPNADAPEDDWTHNELCELGAYKELEHLETFLSTLESEKPMELEEEVKRYYSDNFEYISSEQPTLSILTNIARHFTDWQKAQMMKEAVEGKIIFLLNGDVAVNIGDTDKYNLGQKIRVIVLPKED